MPLPFCIKDNIYKSTFGNQRGNHMPITSKTLFPLASVSKAISAIIIALMVERGQLSFEETFQLPYLK
ncbi:MAG: serine hydrolase [Candidatus Amoebophilus sp.]